MLKHNEYIFTVTKSVFTFTERLIVCAVLWYASRKLDDQFLKIASLSLFFLAIYQIGIEVFLGIKHFALHLPKSWQNHLAFWTTVGLSYASIHWIRYITEKFKIFAALGSF